MTLFVWVLDAFHFLFLYKFSPTVYFAVCMHLTLFSQQEGVEAEVIYRQVDPALPRDSALPVAAGVIVHQLLFLRHSKQLPHLQLGFTELPRILVFLRFATFILFSDDALQTNWNFGSVKIFLLTNPAFILFKIQYKQ